jgi:hypothetical protein
VLSLDKRKHNTKNNEKEKKKHSQKKTLPRNILTQCCPEMRKKMDKNLLGQQGRVNDGTELSEKS